MLLSGIANVITNVLFGLNEIGLQNSKSIKVVIIMIII
jgi:hypothetical protein